MALARKYATVHPSIERLASMGQMSRRTAVAVLDVLEAVEGPTDVLRCVLEDHPSLVMIEHAPPHLDALAAGGLRYSQFYNTARCWPSTMTRFSTRKR